MNQSLQPVKGTNLLFPTHLNQNGQTPISREFLAMCAHKYIWRWGNPKTELRETYGSSTIQGPRKQHQANNCSFTVCGYRRKVLHSPHTICLVVIICYCGPVDNISMYLFIVMLASKSSTFVTCRGRFIRRQSPKY